MTPNAQMFLVKLPCYRLILPLSIMALVFALLHAAATEKHDLALVGIVATEGVCELRVCLAFVVRIVVQLRSRCVAAKIRLGDDVKRPASQSITMSFHVDFTDI